MMMMIHSDSLSTHFAFQVTDGNKKQLHVNCSAVCRLCT